MAWLSISRSRSAAIASATAARCSAAASRERSASSSSLRASVGASPPPIRGVTGVACAGGGVVGAMSPDPTNAAIGMRHPALLAVAPNSSSSRLLRRNVDTETPHASAAAARPRTGPPARDCRTGVTAPFGGVILEGGIDREYRCRGHPSFPFSFLVMYSFLTHREVRRVKEARL